MYIYPGIVAISGLSAPLLGGLLMDVSIWRPFILAVFLSLASVPFLLVIPENWHLATPRVVDIAPRSSHDSTDSIQIPDASETPSGHTYSSLPQEEPVNTTIVKQRRMEDPNQLFASGLLLCYTMFFLKRLAFTSQSFVYQYASQYLQWSLERTVILQFSRAMGATLVNCALIPGLSTYVINATRISTKQLDRSLVNGSASILAVGFGLVWIAKAPALFIIGMCHVLGSFHPLSILFNSYGDMWSRRRTRACSPRHRRLSCR